VPPKDSLKGLKGEEKQASMIKRTTALIEKNDNDKFTSFAIDLPRLKFLANKRFLKELAICFESPVFIAPFVRLLKSPTEAHGNKEVILRILENLFCGNEKVLIAVNSPACDTYMTLLKMLMQNTKVQSQRMNQSGISAQLRQQLALQDQAVDLFISMFEQRRPTIIRDIACIGSSGTLLKEQNLAVPSLVDLPHIVEFLDQRRQYGDIRPEDIHVQDYLKLIKDVRCWIKYFYEHSPIPKLTKVKALERCIQLLLQVVRVVWADFAENVARRGEYLMLIKATFNLIDWLCNRDQEGFIFNEIHGKENLEFILDRTNVALSEFRKPQELHMRVPMEDLTHNEKENKAAQDKRKYDIFPFTPAGAVLQNILY